jgi:hypothetical protein
MSESFDCECGKSYKHYPSLYKHQRRHKHGKFSNGVGAEQSPPDSTGIAHQSVASIPPIQEPEIEPDSTANDDDRPKWQDFEFEVELEEATTPIPTMLKGLKRDGRGKKVRNMTGAERDSQKRIIGIAYRSVDGIVERYGKVVADPEYEITRTQSDYDWVSNLTLDMCEEQGLSGIPISATGLWVIGSGYWVGKPVMDIQSKRTKPRRRFLSRLPFIGKRFRQREVEAIQDIISPEDKVQDERND